MGASDPISLSEAEAHLAHYGVKGMKWGVRRTEAQLNKASKSKVRDYSTAKKVAGTVIRLTIPTALAATGAGTLVTLGASLSMRVLSDPTVKEALSDVGNYVKSSVPDINISSIKNPVTKVKVSS